MAVYTILHRVQLERVTKTSRVCPSEGACIMTAKLHLLGPPSLVTDGRVARMHSAKILALLAYLILEASGRHSMEKLATLFWGESPDAQARASLRHGLYSLLVTLQPLHERAYQHLMQIHVALGDRDGMRHQYRLCVEVLAREMGVKPSPETQALYQELTVAKAVPTGVPHPDTASWQGDRPLEIPFLGRERELAILQVRLNQAIAGRGRLILVSGESGIGKTRLIKELLHTSTTGAVGRPLPVRWLAGRCYESEARAPYTMWSDALQPMSAADWQPFLADLALVWRQQLARLLPALAPTLGEVEGMTAAESRLRLLQGVVQCLAKVTQSCALVLFFDDLQDRKSTRLNSSHTVIS